jgi:hypothetical protein
VSRRAAGYGSEVAPPNVTIFISAGRCGTQWLAATMKRLYGEAIDVEHEPLRARYRSRRYFRRYDDPEAILRVPLVRRHFEHVANLDRPYVETGWPLYGAAPLFAERFGDRLRVVHLTRHPVPTALSQLALNFYADSPRDDEFTRVASLAPTDANVFHPEYAGRWSAMTPYEKCLYWWTEMSLFGLEFPERYPDIRFLRIRSEEVLSGNREQLERLCELMALPWHDGWLAGTNQSVDRWPRRIGRGVDPGAVRDHPATIDTARRLGYDAVDVDVVALRAHYRGAPWRRRLWRLRPSALRVAAAGRIRRLRVRRRRRRRRAERSST